MDDTESNKTPQWLMEVSKANAPFSVENCPALRLFCGLQMVPQEADALAVKVANISKTMTLIDSVPDQRAILDEVTLAEIYYNLVFYDIWLARRYLANSLKSIEDAHKRVSNLLGELKFKYQEPLHKHREGALQLMALFDQAPEYPVNRAFAIRGNLLTLLHRAYEDFLVPIITLRHSLKDLTLPAQLVENLAEVESELFSLRAMAARWGDNPHQKLSATMADCQKRTSAVAANLKRLQQNAQYECQQLGMIFANRQGIYRVKRC